MYNPKIWTVLLGNVMTFFGQNSKGVAHWKFSTVRVHSLVFWPKNSWCSPAKRLIFLVSAFNSEAKTPNEIALIAWHWNSCSRIDVYHMMSLYPSIQNKKSYHPKEIFCFWKGKLVIFIKMSFNLQCMTFITIQNDIILCAFAKIFWPLAHFLGFSYLQKANDLLQAKKSQKRPSAQWCPICWVWYYGQNLD